MSHIVEIQTQIRDPVAVHSACTRLALPAPLAGSHHLYSETVTGLGVQLPGWTYPVVCQTDTGQLRYDNFGGHWGAAERLDELLQAYAVEKAKLTARRQGHAVTEQQLDCGSIKLTVSVGEAT